MRPGLTTKKRLKNKARQGFSTRAYSLSHRVAWSCQSCARSQRTQATSPNTKSGICQPTPQVEKSQSKWCLILEPTTPIRPKKIRDLVSNSLTNWLKSRPRTPRTWVTMTWSISRHQLDLYSLLRPRVIKSRPVAVNFQSHRSLL